MTAAASVDDGTPAARAALQAWLEHMRENIAGGRQDLFMWVVEFFAHLIQRPWEKPRVALVLQGGKGVGKNVAVETPLHLVGLGVHARSNPRMLVGNFNSHFEHCLAIVLDEALWSGDKQAEGRLKHLITGSFHTIERKGFEPYQARNLARVVILGNERWLVPATADERRFTVLKVGNGRKQDGAFFGAMVDGMQGGGYSLLLHFSLLDSRSVRGGHQPRTRTEALQEQKRRECRPR